MVQKKQGAVEDDYAIHKYYMDILNCMPNVVYWIDKDCKLKGCNTHFVALLGLKSIQDFSGTPYEQMTKLTHWSKERIDAFRLDDMAVLFSGEPQYHVDELPIDGEKGTVSYYQSTRVPLFDASKQVIGLVVILIDVTTSKKQENLSLSDSKGAAKSYETNNTPRVLMVEDNFIAQKVERSLLTSLNCRVDIAASGDKALLLFEPGLYDMVLMDIGLEDTTGYLVAKQFRQREEGTEFHVPIIAITSYQAEDVKYDCNDYLMDGVLTKPLTIEQAKQLIQRYVYQEDVTVYGLKRVT